MLDLALIVIYTLVQVGYLCSELLDFFFLSRPVNWVDPAGFDALGRNQLPSMVLAYPVLREPEETMRTTLYGLEKLDYPSDRLRIIAVVNCDDWETIESLERLRSEHEWLELMVVPGTSDPSWDPVWRSWDEQPEAYWWHVGRRAGVRDLPPKKTRQLIYLFYTLVDELGEDWVLDYIDADSVPAPDHFKEGATGLQSYDVLQCTNIAGNLLDSWAASWHAMDHMAWDGFMYPHLSDDGHQPFWVLGKGLFYKAADLVAVGSFNPWVAIEDPEVGMRLWKHGKRLGVIAEPLIEEVPVTFGRGITQRKRWMCGFFQSLGAPLRIMGFTPRERLRARLNLLPCLSLILNPIGIPLGIWALVTFAIGSSPLPVGLVWLSALTLALYIGVMIVLYVHTWRRTAIVLNTRSERLRYLVRVSPPFLFAYWILWSVPILMGLGMYVRDRGLAWERTTKIDANHELVRTIR